MFRVICHISHFLLDLTNRTQFAGNQHTLLLNLRLIIFLEWFMEWFQIHFKNIFPQTFGIPKPTSKPGQKFSNYSQRIVFLSVSFCTFPILSWINFSRLWSTRKLMTIRPPTAWFISILRDDLRGNSRCFTFKIRTNWCGIYYTFLLCSFENLRFPSCSNMSLARMPKGRFFAKLQLTK